MTRLGTAPDSWGVWFPQDDRQVPWQVFLDEVAEAGYSAVELGPYGYLPTDPDQLVKELESRGLQLAGGWIDGPLERAGVWEGIRKQLDAVARLVVDAGGEYLGVVAQMYSDPHTGKLVSVRELSEAQWAQYTGLADRIGEGARKFGLPMLFHPHADSPIEFEPQIERFLSGTDPELVGLLHDVGHHAYRGGDPVRFYREHHDRVGAVHLKSVDDAVARQVAEEEIPWGRAVELGVFAAPDEGAVDFHALKRAMDEFGYGGWSVVEQDMYPAPPEKPLPIAQSTYAYLTEVGFE